MRLPPCRAWLLMLLLIPCPALAAGKAKHVVIIIMDGLRPDSITETDMPNLSKLAKTGSFFANHHSTFISLTDVNGASLATGTHPSRSSVIGNREYRPDVELLQPIEPQGEWEIWKGDQVRPEGWLRAKTLPELAREAGLKTVVAGTKPVSLLWDRSWKNRTVDQPTLFAGKAIPAALLDKIMPDLGPFPNGANSRYFANSAQDTWTTRVLTEKLWADGVPHLSVLWLSEPDYAQHGSGPGSETSKAALKSSDDCLAMVLTALDKKNARAATDVLIVSDHGFSTIARQVDVTEELWLRDFKVGPAFLKAPDPGTVLTVPLGSSFAFYVIGNDKAVIDKLVSYVQTAPWAGVIFTRDGAEGTFKLSDVKLDPPGAPDVVVSMRWDDGWMMRRGLDGKPVRVGMQGTLIADTTYKPGQGMHGSLSRFDIRNTLVAAGPNFKAGFSNKFPSANTDVAPTVAQLLGIAPKQAMDGRVLSEALIDGKAPEGAPQTETMTAKRTVGAGLWVQYLKVTKFAGQTYLDEGNAGAPPAEPAP